MTARLGLNRAMGLPQPNPYPNHRALSLLKAHWIATSVLVMGLIVSLGAFWFIDAGLDGHRRTEFEWVAHNRNRALKKGIEDGLEAVRSIRVLFRVSERVDRREFADFAQALFTRYQGIHALEWVPRVPAAQREAHEADGRAAVPGYRIWESDADTPGSASGWTTHFPVFFAELARAAPPLLGLDYGANPVYRELMARAWRSGRMAVSGRVDLMRGEDAQYGFMAFLPVYANGAPATTEAERQEALAGFAVGVFRIAELANASISLLEPRGVEFLVRDESAPEGEQFLDFYASRLTPLTGAADSRVSPGWNVEQAPRVTESFPVADRRWSITCSPTRQFRSAEGFRAGAWFVLGGGLLLTFGMVAFSVHTRRAIQVRLGIEQELRESGQKLRILFDQSPDTIMTVDREGRVLLTNRPIPEALGSCALGQRLEDVLPAEHREWYRQAVQRAFDIGEGGELRVSRGNAGCWEVRTAPLRVEGGVSAGMVIVTDVTEQCMLEAHANRNARLASLGVIAAGVAHEINNPNNAIQFNASILARSWGDILQVLARYRESHGEFTVGGVPVAQALDGMPRLIEGITKGALRIQRIVGNLKHMARPDEGPMDAAVDLGEVLRTAFSILQGQIRRYTDDFRFDLPDTLPPVQGNPQQLEQVFINLVLNALQSLEDRSEGVHVVVAPDPEGQVIRVSVTDEGRGIPEEVRGRVFDPFFTTRGAAGGTGLGLSISHRIVENHGGRMELISRSGRGTEVVVRLPVAGAR